MHVQARTRKLEAESKLAGLQKDLAELGSVSGDQAGQEEAQTVQLHQVWHFSHSARICAVKDSHRPVAPVVLECST